MSPGQMPMIEAVVINLWHDDFPRLSHICAFSTCYVHSLLGWDADS